MSIYEFRACPQCGSGNVSGNDFLGPSYTCGDCDWRYKQGLLGERGTHPDEFGRYCPDCRTVYSSPGAADHVCTVVGVLDETGGSVTFDSLATRLSEYQSRSEVAQSVKTGVWQRTVAVLPGGRLVRRDDPTGRTEMHELILDLVGADSHTGKQEMVAAADVESDWGEEFVQQCLRELTSDGSIRARPGHQYRLTEGQQ